MLLLTHVYIKTCTNMSFKLSKTNDALNLVVFITTGLNFSKYKPTTSNSAVTRCI